MTKNNDRRDYSILIDRVVELEKAAEKEKAVKIDKDIGIDYEVEYRKQTGKNFVTGDVEVQ